MHRTPSFRSSNPTSRYLYVGSSTPVMEINKRITALKLGAGDDKFNAMTSSDNTSSDDDVMPQRIHDGEVTLRRKRKGRAPRPCSDPLVLETRSRTPSPTPTNPSLTLPQRHYRASTSSRDSGIVSVVFDDFQLSDPHDNINNNYEKLPSNQFPITNDSSEGFSLNSKHQNKSQVPRKPTSLALPPSGKCSCTKR